MDGTLDGQDDGTHQLPQFLPECASQIKEFIAFLHALEHFAIVWRFGDTKLDKRKLSDAGVGELVTV
jgi:hypothetical protein